jgi:hypothetical protein
VSHAVPPVLLRRIEDPSGLGVRESFLFARLACGPGRYQCPMPERVPAKRVVLRLPASLHHQLELAAASEGVSLNQFACAALASAVQWRSDAGDASHWRYPKSKEELGRQMWADLLR